MPAPRHRRATPARTVAMLLALTVATSLAGGCWGDAEDKEHGKGDSVNAYSPEAGAGPAPAQGPVVPPGTTVPTTDSAVQRDSVLPPP